MVTTGNEWIFGRTVLACVLAGVFAFVGCVADPEHTNRFDPEAPIELQAGGTLTGRVILEKSASAAGVTVALSDGSSSAVTEADGRFALADIRPGPYSLVLSRDGYRQMSTAEYEIGVGEVKDIGNIELIRGRGRITGVVGFPATAVAVPVTVTLRGESVAEDTGTGADGAFTFNEIPVGTYTLTARGEGFVATCGDTLAITADAQTVQASPLNLLSAVARVWLQAVGGDKIEYTNQTALELNLSEVDTSAFSAFRFGASQDLSAAVFAPLVAAQPVTLEGDDGAKSVYVQFKDRCGNETEIYSTPDVDLDREAPAGKVVINDSAPYLTTEGGTAVLDISASDTRSPVTAMQVTVDGVAGAWESYSVTANVTFDTAAAGTKTVSVIFRDEAGNESAAATDEIVFDNVAPTGLSMTLSGTVADGAQSATLTRSASVKASLAASDPLKIEMAVSAESLNCADAAYVPFATATTVILTGADALKTVYACFRDEAGNVTSAPITAEITLDTTSPTGTSVTLAGGSALIKQADATSPVAVSLVATDAAEYQLSTDHSFKTAAWTAMGAATVDATITLDAGEGERYAYARFRDAAGNESVAVYDLITVDGKAPAGVAVRIREGDLTNSAAVTLELESVDAEQMYIDGDVSDTAETKEWIDFAGTLQVSLTDPAGGSEAKNISAKFRDAAGNEADAAPVSVIYDNTAPSGAAISLEGELQGKEGERSKSTSITAYPFVNVTLSAADPLDIFIAVSESSLTCSSANYEPLFSPKPFVLSATDGTKTVYACFKDKAGNYTSSPVSDTITLDMTVPSSPSIAVGNLSASGWTKEYQALQVTLSATDASQMRLGFWLEGGPLVKREFAFKTYATSDIIPLTVTDGGQPVDGKYHVWAEFVDSANNITPRMESIVQLDTTKPATTTIQLGDGSAYTNNQILTVGVMPGAETGFHSRIESMRVYPASAGNPGNWTDFAPVTTVSLPNCPSEDCSHTIRLDLKDEAGNESSTAAEASVYLDTMRPSAPNLSPPKYLITSDTSITLTAGFPTRPPDNYPCDKNFLRFEMSGEQNPGPDYVDCADIAGSQCDPSDPVNNPVKFVYQLATDQQNVLRVRAMDMAGNASQDTFTVVTQDSTAPRAPLITRSEPEDGSIFLEWASPNSDADIAAYLVYYGSSSGTYNGTEGAEGISPIIVPAGTTECADGSGTCFGGNFRLTGLKNATDLFVAVSAFDQVQPDPLEGAKSIELRIQPNQFNPTLFGRAQSVYRRMAVADHYLLAVTGDGVEAIELDDGPDLMAYKGGVFFPTADASDLAVDLAGKRLYLAAGESGVAVIDLSNLLQNGQLLQGSLKSTFRVPGTAVRRVEYMSADSGQRDLVFAAGDNGLYVVDATDPDAMSVMFGTMAGNEITAIEAADDTYGRHLFVGNSQYGLAAFTVDTDGSLVPDAPEYYQPKDWGYCTGGCPVSEILVSRDHVIAVDRVMGAVNMDRAKLADFPNTYIETGLLLSYSGLSAGPYAINSPDAMAALPDDTDGRRRFAILGSVPNQEYGKIEVWKYLDPTAPPADKDKLLCDKGCNSVLPDLVTLQAEGGGILFDATGGGRHADDWIVVSRQALGFEVFKYDPASTPAWITADPELDPTEDMPGDSRRLVKAGDLVLLADGANGFIVMDASMPVNIRVAGRVPARDLDGAVPVTDGRPKVLAVAAAGPAALVCGTFGLVVVDLAKARDLDDQTRVGVSDIKKTVLEDKQIRQIEVSGSRAYVWEYTAALTHLLHVFDISDVLRGDYPSFDEGPDLLLSRQVQSPGAGGEGVNLDPAAFAVSGDFVFLVRNPPVAGNVRPDIVALNLADTANVKEAKAAALSGGTLTSIRVEKRRAYLTDRKFGLLAFDLGPLVAAVNDPPAVVPLSPAHVLPVDGSPGVVATQTELAFVGTREGISVANVAGATSAPVSDVGVAYEVKHMAVDGQVLWAAAGEGGLLAYSLARPARSAQYAVKTLTQGGEAGGVAALGDWLFAINTYDYTPGVYYNWVLEQYYARNLRALVPNTFNDPDFPTESFIGVGQVAVSDGGLYIVQYRVPHANSCTGDPDCPGGFKCITGTCNFNVGTCNVDADCPQPGFRCQESPDPPKKCVYAPAVRCTASANCPSGMICKDPDKVANTGEPYVDTNGNGRCDTGVDTFTDLNGNLQCDGDEPWTDTDSSGTWDEGEPFTDLPTCDSGRALRVVRVGIGDVGQPHASISTDWMAPPLAMSQPLAPVMRVADTRVTLGLSGVSTTDGREIGQVWEIDLNDPGLAPRDRVTARYDLTPDETYWTPAFTAIERYGKYVYLLAGRDLVIFDTVPFDLAQKKTVWRLGEQMLRVGDVLFISSQEAQLVRAYSLADPLNPQFLAKVSTTSAGRLSFSGTYLFTGAMRTLANGTRVGGGLQVFDVEAIVDGDASTTPVFNPVVVRSAGSNEIAVSGPYLMLANQSGVEIFEMR
ncbi:MAG: carboxypeptidase regulatory-like domain-containing protein [Deltaproteobacteria bacterium]|nr:carboxypeptidase regulatory-like domain-containing protein [Deltaproteobacteria bacterium]